MEIPPHVCRQNRKKLEGKIMIYILGFLLLMSDLWVVH